MLRYFVFAAVVIVTFAFLPSLIFGIPATGTARGITFVALERTGFAVAALIVGCLGLLYRPNRFAGFTAMTIATMLLMFIGQANQQA